MRIKLGSGLWLLNLLVIMLVVTSAFNLPDLLNIILGLPFILIFPGYVLGLALFPRKEGMNGIERAAVSFGLSIIVVPLIGLILNYYTPWGLTLRSTLYSTASFIFIVSIIAGVRRKRSRAGERFELGFLLPVPPRSGSAWDRVLSVMLVTTILGAGGMLGYVIATPRAGERFTEFYVLGPAGKIADYPVELSMGEEGRIMVGIVNHEREVVSYRVEVRIDGEKDSELGPLVLGHDEKWEQPVSFTPDRVRDNQKVELLLYKNGENEPYREPLRLWVNVKE